MNSPTLTPTYTHQPHGSLRHSLSLAELEAERNDTTHDTPLNLEHISESLHEIPQATNQAFQQLLAQLQERDAERRQAVLQLADERKETTRVEGLLNQTREEVQVLKRAERHHQLLETRVQHLSKQLAEKSAVVQDAENRIRHAVEEGQRQLRQATESYTQDSEEVTKRLAESVTELDSLRVRCNQLEHDLSVEKALSSAAQGEAGSKRSTDKFSKSFVKKKMFELKIARNVIAEKDKTVKELESQLESAQQRSDDAAAANEASESRAMKLEIELEEMKKDIATSRDDASMRQILVEDAQEKLKTMASQVERAKKDTAAALVTANENDEKRKEYKELLESTARRCHEALAEKQASVKESEKLREALTAAEQEISRLGGLLQREGPNNGDYLGSTSPCSTVAEAEANGQTVSSPAKGVSSPAQVVSSPSQVVSSPSQVRPVKSLADLEEATATAPPRLVSRRREGGQQRGRKSEHEGTIESLSRALRTSRLYCDEKNEQLQEANALITRQEEALKKVNREMAGRKEECQVLENRVHKELRPALRAAEESLEERSKELEAVREEFKFHQEMSEKTRSALELEVGNKTERLQETLTSLRETQSELSRSQQKVSTLEEQLADLNEHRRNLEQKIGDLEETSDHRLQSLRAIQEKLVVMESRDAGLEQAVVDAEEEKLRLEDTLALEASKREAAETRAVRKDGIVLELEKRTFELERSHAALKDHLAEKVEHIEGLEAKLRSAEEVAQVCDDALQEQAIIVTRREALFESLTAELRMVIQTRDIEVSDTKQDLTNVERRLKSVAKDLEDEKSSLKTRDRELAETSRKLEHSEAENRRKEGKLAEEEEQYSRLTAEYQAAQDELEGREKQIESHLTSISEKSAKIAGLRAEKAESEKTIRELRKVLDAERSKLELQATRANQLELNLNSVRADLASCEEDLSIRDAEVETLQRSLANVQEELSQMQDVFEAKEDEIASKGNTIASLENSLERSKHQLAVLESHLDGHDTLMKDNREKDECIAVQSGELEHAQKYARELENEKDSLKQEVLSKEEDADSLSRKLANLEAGKSSVDQELERAKNARSTVEKSLNETSASLAALEKSTTEEIADLNATIASLRKVIDEKDSSLNSASETIAQSSFQSNLTKEQLVDSRTRGDRLFSRLNSTEYELASKKETLATLELRFREAQDALSAKDGEIEKMGQTLMLRDQALSSARSKIAEMSKKTNSIAQGELLTMQSKVDAKEKAIANLHNWCCFINGKLHATEKALAERDMDLELSSTAFKKLESQLQSHNDLLMEKESQMRKLESSRVVENSELRSRIHALQSYVDEAKSELDRTKRAMSSKGSEAHSSLVTVSEELIECRAKLKSIENEMSEVQKEKRTLEESVRSHEQSLAASGRTIECLTLDLGRLQSESNSKRDAREANDKNAAEEILKVRSETGYLIVELRKAEAELSAANETAKTWQRKAEELQPLAESTLEAQRAVEIVSSQLVLLRKDTKQRIDLLETQLKEAERERDNAERDCSAAIGDYTAMRARLMEVHSRSSAYGRLAAANTLCTATFVLEGRNAPSEDIMVYILGEDATLGQWSPSRRLSVRVVGEGDNGIIRKCEVVLPSSLATSYKYAADSPDGTLVWEGEGNRSLDLQGNSTFEVTDVWRPSQ